MGGAAAQGHAHVVKTHCDRIMADGTLVNQLNLGPLHKSKFQKASLKLRQIDPMAVAAIL